MLVFSCLVVCYFIVFIVLVVLPDLIADTSQKHSQKVLLVSVLTIHF